MRSAVEERQQQRGPTPIPPPPAADTGAFSGWHRPKSQTAPSHPPHPTKNKVTQTRPNSGCISLNSNNIFLNI
jgi:hypothetical protein